MAIKDIYPEEKTLQEDVPTTMILTRDGAILTTLERNRSLAVERFSPEISNTRIAAARAAFDPDLLATTVYNRRSNPGGTSGGNDFSISRAYSADAKISELLPTGTEMFLSGSYTRDNSSITDSSWTHSGSWSAGINQSLLKGFGTNINLVDLRQAENLAAISQHELRGFVLDLVQQVENAYWDLVLANETLKIRQFAIQLAEDQLQLNRDMIAVGKLAPDGEISAKAERESRKADLVEAEGAVRNRTIDLIRLLNPTEDNQWQIVFAPRDKPEAQAVEINPDISAKLAELYRPDLAQSRLDLANRDLEVIRTRNGLLPQLDAFGSFGRISSGESAGDATRSFDDNDATNYELGLSLDMPLFNRREKAEYRQAEFQQQQAEAAIHNLEQLIQSEVRSSAIDAKTQWAKIEAQQSVVKSRRAEYDLEKDRFSVDKSTNLDVQGVLNNLIQAQLNELSARIGYIKSLTALYHAEGTLLQRRGVGVGF